MNTAKENSDDFFIGDFTESEKVIAAKHILEKQNAAREAYVISTVISVLSMLFVVYLIVGFVVSLPDFGGYPDPGYVPYGRILRWDKGDIIVCFLYIPIMVILIGILIAGIANEYKKLSVYNSYKVYKGEILRIEKNYSFKKDRFTASPLCSPTKASGSLITICRTMKRRSMQWERKLSSLILSDTGMCRKQKIIFMLR